MLLIPPWVSITFSLGLRNIFRLKMNFLAFTSIGQAFLDLEPISFFQSIELIQPALPHVCRGSGNGAFLKNGAFPTKRL